MKKSKNKVPTLSQVRRKINSGKGKVEKRNAAKKAYSEKAKALLEQLNRYLNIRFMNATLGDWDVYQFAKAEEQKLIKAIKNFSTTDDAIKLEVDLMVYDLIKGFNKEHNDTKAGYFKLKAA